MTFTPTTNDPLIGKVVAERYRITELVGAGRFSIVYKGQHLFMDRSVAMKTLQSNLVEDQTVIKRFEKEAVALSKLRHPNIVSVYDCFVHTNGQPFLVMDFLDGHTLEELLTDRGAIPPKLMRAIIFQASAGLAHAHGSGVLHRDIKPDNIILLPREKTDERVRLLDFGFALLQGDLERLTLSGTLCGSPAYISPERWKGKELDARSDIYSLAVVMFQGLTGQLPFKASSLEDLRNMHVTQEPPLLCELMPSLREDIVAQQVMNKALAKDPEERYQTMKDFHNAIKAWSPNSDDAEIANWAKNATPKPPPPVVQTGQPVMAQPVSLQPMPPQAVPAQAAAPAAPAPEPANPHTGPGQKGSNTLRLPAADTPAGREGLEDAETLPNNSAPAFDDAATLPNNSEQPLTAAPKLPVNTASDTNLETLTAEANAVVSSDPGVDPSQQHKGFIDVDLNQHPLSAEALARVAKPNPRASLTKQDVAYIKAIAQTLGDSLGEQAKSIDVPPNLEEELHIAPKDETSRLDFSAMPRPVVQPTVPIPGPKVIPIVDRRQNRGGEETGDNEPVPGSSWGVIDGAPKPLPDAKLSAGQPAAAGGDPVASEWTVKQEVAPWVSNPDEFKPKSGTFGAPASADPPGSFGALEAQGTAQGTAQGASQGSGGFGAPQGSGSGAPQGSGSFGAPQGANSFGAPSNSFSSPQDASGSPQAFGGPGFGTPPGGAPDVPPIPEQRFGAFGTPLNPPEQPPPMPPPPSPTTSSSRISPVLPGSPAAPLSGSPSGPGPEVPWTSAASSSPVDFGKMFPDSDMTMKTGGAAPNLSPGVPKPSSPAGTDIASPTANATNLSVSTGNDRSTPPKAGKKRNRLPTFVDQNAPEDGSGPPQAAPKKGGAGMVIAGIAATVFILAGIGIATWMITNVNPANAPDNNAPAAGSTAPTSATSTPSTAAPSGDTNKAPATSTTPTDNKASSSDDSFPSTARQSDTNSDTKASAADDAVEPAAKSVPPPKAAAAPKPFAPKAADATASAPKAPPKPAKEPPQQSGGWFGFPSFNKNTAASKAPETAPVTANSDTPSPSKPKKKKPKKKRTAPASVARKAAPSASSGGYVEVEVTPGRRAYRSY